MESHRAYLIEAMLDCARARHVIRVPHTHRAVGACRQHAVVLFIVRAPQQRALRLGPGVGAYGMGAVVVHAGAAVGDIGKMGRFGVKGGKRGEEGGRGGLPCMNSVSTWSGQVCSPEALFAAEGCEQKNAAIGNAHLRAGWMAGLQAGWMLKSLQGDAGYWHWHGLPMYAPRSVWHKEAVGTLQCLGPRLQTSPHKSGNSQHKAHCAPGPGRRIKTVYVCVCL